MNRRELIQTGAAASVAATGVMGGVSCGTLAGHKTIQERVAALDMSSYLAEMDHSLGHIDGFTCDRQRDHHLFDEQGRAAARSLTVSSMFRDLPLEGKLHPGMQRRVVAHLQDMNSAVFDGGRLISDTGLAADPEIVEAIKGPDNPGLKFLERFDQHAAETKLSRHKRLRLRTIGIDAVDQMRRQSPAAAFDEAYAKVQQMQRTADLCGSVEAADRRASIMRVGRGAYEKRQREIAEIVGYYDRQLIASNDPRFLAAPQTEHGVASEEPPAGEPGVAAAKPACPPAPKCDCGDSDALAWGEGFAAGKAEAYEKAVWEGKLDGAQGLITAGAWTMGIAGTVAAVGGLLALVDPMVTVVMSGTVGGALLIVGLIILSVGAAKKNRILSEMESA